MFKIENTTESVNDQEHQIWSSQDLSETPANREAAYLKLFSLSHFVTLLINDTCAWDWSSGTFSQILTEYRDVAELCHNAMTMRIVKIKANSLEQLLISVTKHSKWFVMGESFDERRSLAYGLAALLCHLIITSHNLSIVKITEKIFAIEDILMLLKNQFYYQWIVSSLD